MSCLPTRKFFVVFLRAMKTRKSILKSRLIKVRRYQPLLITRRTRRKNVRQNVPSAKNSVILQKIAVFRISVRTRHRKGRYVAIDAMATAISARIVLGMVTTRTRNDRTVTQARQHRIQAPRNRPRAVLPVRTIDRER